MGVERREKVLVRNKTLLATSKVCRPFNRPKCGFDGSACPPDIWQEYSVYILSGSLLLGLVLLIMAGLFVVTIRYDILRNAAEHMSSSLDRAYWKQSVKTGCGRFRLRR